MTSDLDLLRQFARENSQDAFAEIVRRHLNLVYSAARRQVRSPQLAEEIAQSVFADLACNAGKVSGTGFQPVNSLTPWLYIVTRRTAIDAIRKESRRQLREQTAVEMTNMNATAGSGTGVSPVWTDIEAHLDDAMAALDETDRSAILLRYFENKNLREVGETLGTSEDAAQKRVSCAVERLREFFSKRNVTIGASGLAVLISANAVQSAPIGLAATISAAAVLVGTAVHTSAVIAATKIIAMTTLQKTLVTATVAVLAGAGIYEARQAAQLREQNQILQQQQAPLAEQIQQLRRERNDATNRLAWLGDELAKAKSSDNELLKLRGEVGVLRAQLAEGSAAKTIIEQGPLSSARAYYERAKKHSQNHEYEDELDDLNKAIELDPNLAEAYMERANLYVLNLPKEKGGYTAAIADYSRVLELKPNDASARHLRAIDYEQLSQYDDAIADYTTILIEGDTDFSDKELAGEYLNRGRLYQWQKHDYNKAIADYTAALKLDPKIEEVHRSRGRCYELLGESEKAQQDFAVEPKSN